MSEIALKYEGGMIVSKEYELGKTMIPEDKTFIDTITINDPFVIGNTPVKGQEITALLEGKKVYLCVMIKEFTKNKMRISKGAETNFIKELWHKLLKQE